MSIFIFIPHIIMILCYNVCSNNNLTNKIANNMKKYTLFILLFFFSNVFAEPPEECPDVSLDKAIQVLEGANTIEVNGYIWQVETYHKTSVMYIRKLDGTISQLGPYPSNFYWEDYGLIRNIPAENIIIRLDGEKTIEPDNFLSICYYDVILAGTANPIARFALLNPQEVHAIPPPIDFEANQQPMLYPKIDLRSNINL